MSCFNFYTETGEGHLDAILNLFNSGPLVTLEPGVSSSKQYSVFYIRCPRLNNEELRVIINSARFAIKHKQGSDTYFGDINVSDPFEFAYLQVLKFKIMIDIISVLGDKVIDCHVQFGLPAKDQCKKKLNIPSSLVEIDNKGEQIGFIESQVPNQSINTAGSKWYDARAHVNSHKMLCGTMLIYGKSCTVGLIGDPPNLNITTKLSWMIVKSVTTVGSEILFGLSGSPKTITGRPYIYPVGYKKKITS